ncbi:hypothetical protein ALC53_12209, partial [Atta colombica]
QMDTQTDINLLRPQMTLRNMNSGSVFYMPLTSFADLQKNILSGTPHCPSIADNGVGFVMADKAPLIFALFLAIKLSLVFDLLPKMLRCNIFFAIIDFKYHVIHSHFMKKIRLTELWSKERHSLLQGRTELCLLKISC